MKVSETYCPEEAVQIITGKKQTRNGIYYQVQILLLRVCIIITQRGQLFNLDY